MTPIDLLNLWMTYTKFDSEQSAFKLFSKEYEFYKCNKQILEFYKNWDSSGIISLLYAKYCFINFIKSQQISIYDLLNNNILDLNDLTNIFKEFNSKDFNDMEDYIIKSLEYISTKLVKNKLIGNFNKEELLKAANYILENILYLNIDIFKKGGEILPFNNFSSKILMFDSIAECLLTIENSIDGIYLCYITNQNKPDGFFGYYIKNNGNLFSINERLTEKYIGQHKIMSNRNNRYSNNKKYDLFPYEIIEFNNEDSLGYAAKHIINKDKLEYKNLDNISLMNIIIMLYLFTKKYVGTKLEGEELYVNSLLQDNIKPLLNNTKNELIKYNDSSALIKWHNNFNINFSKEEFLDGTLCHKFNKFENENSNNELGYFQNINQKLIDIYGKDFDFNNEIKNILITDKTKYLLTSNDLSTTDITFNNEYIGTKKSLELQAFYNLRIKLANHIRKNQINDFNNFGGINELKKWYKELLLKNYNNIKNICKEVYKDPLKGELEYIDNFCFKNEKRKLEYICYYNQKNSEINSIYWIDNKVNEYNNKNHQFIDIENNKSCYHYFIFKIPTLDMLEEIFQTKFPNFCIGYCNSAVKQYIGNSIIDMVDPVDRLDSLLHTKTYKFSFDFVIGFSKSNFKK